MRAGGCQIKTFRCLPEAGKDDCAIPSGRDAVHRITVFAVFVIRQQPFIEHGFFCRHLRERQEEKAFAGIGTVGEKLQTVAFPIERGQDRIAALQGVFQRGNSDCGRRRKSDVAKWDDVATCFCTVDKMRIRRSQQGCLGVQAWGLLLVKWTKTAWLPRLVYGCGYRKNDPCGTTGRYSR